MSELERLIDAAKRGDFADVSVVLHNHAELINQRDESGATALHYAALGGHHSVVEELVRQGADINATDGEFGATPTGWAIEYLREMAGSLRLSWTILHMQYDTGRRNGLSVSWAAFLRFAVHMILKENHSKCWRKSAGIRKSRSCLVRLFPDRMLTTFKF
jgi:hypothetical protein